MSSPSRWFRWNLTLHRWASLLATLPFLVLCLTGVVLIFHEEIDVALGAARHTDARGAHDIDACMKTAVAAFPDERIISVGLDPDGHPGVLLVVFAPPTDTGFANARLVFFELATGKLLGDEQPGKSFTGKVLELHAEWFLGPAGMLLGALVGLLVVVSLVTGLVIYAPYMKRIAFAVVRRDRGPRLLQLDLHNFVGVVVIGWAFVVSLTGFLLGFSQVALGIWQFTDLAAIRGEYADVAPVDFRAPPTSISRVVDVARTRAPQGWDVASVLYPGTDLTTSRHFAVLLAGSEGLESKMLRAVLIDAETGVAVRDVELPAYLQAIFVAEPLHFGNYGGLPLKVLWSVFNVLTLVIVINGAWLFFDRRRRRFTASITEAADGVA